MLLTICSCSENIIEQGSLNSQQVINLTGQISLKPGMRHTITVSLDKNPEKIKIDIGGEIGNW